jgi:hypothetical protein
MSTNQYPVRGDGQSTAGQPVETMSQSPCFCSDVHRCTICLQLDGPVPTSEYGNSVESHLPNMDYHSSILNHHQIRTLQYATPSNIDVQYSGFGILCHDPYPSPPLASGFTEDRE